MAQGTAPVIRTARDDDLEWIVRWHGQLYLEELGWDHRFEDFVADIVAGFRSDHDEAAERCWVAELDGERVGLPDGNPLDGQRSAPCPQALPA
jgi:hypothetical protein